MTIFIVDVLDRKHVRSIMLEAYKSAMEQYHNGDSAHDVSAARGRLSLLRELAAAFGMEELVIV